MIWIADCLATRAELSQGDIRFIQLYYLLGRLFQIQSVYKIRVKSFAENFKLGICCSKLSETMQVKQL